MNKRIKKTIAITLLIIGAHLARASADYRSLPQGRLRKEISAMLENAKTLGVDRTVIATFSQTLQATSGDATQLGNLKFMVNQAIEQALLSPTTTASKAQPAKHQTSAAKKSTSPTLQQRQRISREQAADREEKELQQVLEQSRREAEAAQRPTPKTTTPSKKSPEDPSLLDRLSAWWWAEPSADAAAKTTHKDEKVRVDLGQQQAAYLQQISHRDQKLEDEEALQFRSGFGRAQYATNHYTVQVARQTGNQFNPNANCGYYAVNYGNVLLRYLRGTMTKQEFDNGRLNFEKGQLPQWKKTIIGNRQTFGMDPQDGESLGNDEVENLAKNSTQLRDNDVTIIPYGYDLEPTNYAKLGRGYREQQEKRLKPILANLLKTNGATHLFLLNSASSVDRSQPFGHYVAIVMRNENRRLAFYTADSAQPLSIITRKDSDKMSFHAINLLAPRLAWYLGHLSK